MENKKISNRQESLMQTVLDDSNQMIQLSDLETFTMLYANKPARLFTGHENQPYVGEHCYKYMMGLDEVCPFCPMLKMNGTDMAETEVDNGQQIFQVKTKIIDWNGKKAFLEYAWDVTEIRRSEKIFESQVKTLIESIPEAQGIFHLDLTADCCMNVNGNAENAKMVQTKQKVDDTIRMIASFVPDEKGQEEFFEQFCLESLKRAYKNGNVEIRKETKSYFDDGSIRHARITARLLENPTTDHLECIIYGMDISEEKEEQLHYEKNLQEQLAIFNALGKDYLNLFLINAKTGNARILKMDGYVTSGLENHKEDDQRIYPYYATCEQYIKERVHPDDKQMMLEAMKLDKVIEELTKKQEYVDSYRTQTDGETHYYRFKYMWLEDTGQIIAGFHNIDEIVMKERAQQKRLSEALEKAERASNAKTEFLNGISHDIRTPLNAILGFTRLAKQCTNDSVAVRDYLKKVEVSGKQLLTLINDVLDMSHIESGKIERKKENVNLSELLEELLTISREEIERKKIRFTFHMEEVMHENVITDRLRVSRILLNILSNAVKFTEPGGMVGFVVSEMKGAESSKGIYEFRIKDTGIGMSTEFQKHIFESFSREQTSTLSGVEGSGLGMSIAKRYVDLLGGTIDIKSQPGNGTEFIVKLPLEFGEKTADSLQTGKVLPESDMEEMKKKIQGKRILLVEDNMLNQEIAMELLTQAGFVVDTAENGKEAVEQLESAKSKEYELVLMDIQMPVMDGYAATKAIRSLPDAEIAQIPIFALSANAFQEDKDKAEAAGMNGYISKPVQIEEMLQTIMKVF